MNVRELPQIEGFDFEYAIPMKQITVTAGLKITEENPCKVVLMSPEE